MTGVCIAALCLYAQTSTPPASPPVPEVKGLPPRATPGDYQAQVQVGAYTVAAEFVGHAVPTADGLYNSEDYVAVETAVFGAPGARLVLSQNDFSLRINKKKSPLPSTPTEMVLHSLKDPSWEPPAPPEKSKTSFGSGSQDSGPPPPPPHMPVELQHVMNQHVLNSTMLEGNRALPQAGLFFFQYHGQPKSIRSVELIYKGPAGEATLKLQP